MLLTSDGDVITGRIVGEEDNQLIVRTHPFSTKNMKLWKYNIEDRRPSNISEMPQHLINILTREEIFDLIAYLRSGGKREDAAFRSGP